MLIRTISCTLQYERICATPLVTSPPPPIPRALLRPPHQLLNARGSLWVSQSVSVCVRRLLSVSLPTCVQPGCSQGARPSVGLIIRSETTPGLQSPVGLFVFFQSLWLFLLKHFPLLGLRNNLPSCLGLLRM